MTGLEVNGFNVYVFSHSRPPNPQVTFYEFPQPCRLT